MTTISDPGIRRRIAALVGVAPHLLEADGGATAAQRRAFDDTVSAILRIQAESGQDPDALTGALTEFVRRGTALPAALLALRPSALAALAAGAALDETLAVSAVLMQRAKIPGSDIAIAWDRLLQSTLTGDDGNGDRPVAMRALAADLPRLLAAAPRLGLKGMALVDAVGAATQVMLRGQGRADAAAGVMLDWMNGLAPGAGDPMLAALETIARDGLPDGMAAGSDLGAMLGRAAGRLDLHGRIRNAMAAAEGVVAQVAATIYVPPGIASALGSVVEAAGIVPAQLARLGRFGFGLSTVAYTELRRSSAWRWPAQDRIGRAPALQYVGPGMDEITLPATLHPWWRGGLGQIDQLRAMAAEGQPLLFTLSDGRVLGFWVITRIEETGRVFGPGGLARAIDLQISLAYYGEDDPTSEAA